MAVLSLEERRARLASGSGAMAERRRALFGTASSPAGDASMAASLGAMFKAFGEQLMAQTVQPAPQPAPVAPSPPPVDPETEPSVGGRQSRPPMNRPLVAAKDPAGELRGWILESRDSYTGAIKRTRIVPQPDGISYEVQTQDSMGNPRRAILRADYGKAKLRPIDD